MHHYTIDDIIRRTHLSRSFINKCNRRLEPLLGRFRIKGDKNKLLYDDESLQIWDVIKQEKEKGSNIGQIQRVLERILQPNKESEQPPTETKTIKPNNETNEATHIQFLIESIKDAYINVIAEKDKRMLLLEAGSKEKEETKQKLADLETFKTIQEEKRRQRKALYAKVATLNGWSQRKDRARVFKQIEELDT